MQLPCVQMAVSHDERGLTQMRLERMEGLSMQGRSGWSSAACVVARNDEAGSAAPSPVPLSHQLGVEVLPDAGEVGLVLGTVEVHGARGELLPRPAAAREMKGDGSDSPTGAPHLVHHHHHRGVTRSR